jgi:hypothetical protein
MQTTMVFRVEQEVVAFESNVNVTALIDTKRDNFTIHPYIEMKLLLPQNRRLPRPTD